MKAQGKLTLRRKADKLWGTIGGEDECEVCATLEKKYSCTKLNPHHYIGRANKRLRWDLRNKVKLCPSHHTLGFPSAHQDPKWFEDWMKKYRKADWEYCNKVKNEIAYSIDYKEIIEKLKEVNYGKN